jgi:signal transduction histidine kinase
MPAGGVLKIRTEMNPGSIRVLIDRQGPEIPPEDLKRIFDPIHAAGQGGEGIGLLFSRKIIEDHGGTLGVESGLHQGTTYTAELPLIGSIQGGMHVGEKARSGCR